MVRKDFWRSDWFLGVIVAVAVFPQDNGAPPIPTASVDLHIARALPTATLPANMMLKIANEQSAVDVRL